ncbi:MAG TPA: Gfo/Idh/MocA family oxidoreductase [Candidatus Dormibacteraeota bacterium]|nr:Gfo/Idh/MocA family oxidoreductase [Candidatus Dormibacteraeota bacterium]
MGRAARGLAGGSAAHRGRDGGGDEFHRPGGCAPRGRHIASDRLGWGVLGAAWIAGRAVLPAITKSRNGRLVAIASRDPERARSMAQRHSIPKVARDYDEVLADPEVMAVYIPLVNSLHREWTLRALAAGKHVLCEKPLGMNAREAEEMAAAARRSGLLLMEAFMYRFHPRMAEFIDGLRGDERPLHVQASFGFPLTDTANYRMKADLGGGALLDVGCYTASVARWLLGEPDTVLARAHLDRATGVDMSVSALLHFAEGGTASLWCSFESAEEQGLTAVTRKGTYNLERPFTAWQDPHDPYQLMVESFADSVMRGLEPAVTLDESIANMRVLDWIREEMTV